MSDDDAAFRLWEKRRGRPWRRRGGTTYPGCFVERVWICLIAKELSFFGATKSPQERVNEGVSVFEGWRAGLFWRRAAGNFGRGNTHRVFGKNEQETDSAPQARRISSGKFTAHDISGSTRGQLVGGRVVGQVVKILKRKQKIQNRTLQKPNQALAPLQ